MSVCAKCNDQRDAMNRALSILSEALNDSVKSPDVSAKAATPEKAVELPPIPEKLMPLSPWQFAFSARVAELIRFAHSRGYTVTFGEARVPRECVNCTKASQRKESSLHFDGLAIDLNLFKDGIWLQKSEDHRELGVFWESLGGSWGGRFGDGNHYSIAYNGRK